MGLNNFSVSGRVGQDSELKFLSQDVCLCEFSFAFDTFKQKQKVSNWIKVKAFGKAAELLSEHAKKGTQLSLSGRLEIDTWEKDGKKFEKTVLVANDFQLPPFMKEPKETDVEF